VIWKWLGTHQGLVCWQSKVDLELVENWPKTNSEMMSNWSWNILELILNWSRSVSGKPFHTWFQHYFELINNWKKRNLISNLQELIIYGCAQMTSVPDQFKISSESTRSTLIINLLLISSISVPIDIISRLDLYLFEISSRSGSNSFLDQFRFYQF
jgi:hypothetical protein